MSCFAIAAPASPASGSAMVIGAVTMLAGARGTGGNPGAALGDLGVGPERRHPAVSLLADLLDCLLPKRRDVDGQVGAERLHLKVERPVLGFARARVGELLARKQRTSHADDVAHLGERLVEGATVEAFDDALAAGANAEH